jgi:hypothetical protein
MRISSRASSLDCCVGLLPSLYVHAPYEQPHGYSQSPRHDQQKQAARCVRRREEQQEVPHDKRETTECHRNAEKLGNRVLVAKPRPRPSIVRRIVQVAVEEDAWPTTNSKKSIVRQHDNGFQSFRCIRDFLVFAISSASFFSSGNASLYSLDSTLLRRFPNA